MADEDLTVDELRLVASLLREAACERDREPGQAATDLRQLAGKAERVANRIVWREKGAA